MKLITVPKEKETFRLILKLARALRCFQDDATFCEDITYTQFAILDFVAEADGVLPLSELHDRLGVEKSTTTRLVAPLLKKGLVTKEQSREDRRAFDLVLTDEGIRIHGVVWECLAGHLRSMVGSIPGDDVQHVMRSLSRFAQALDQCCKD